MGLKKKKKLKKEKRIQLKLKIDFWKRAETKQWKEKIKSEFCLPMYDEKVSIEGWFGFYVNIAHVRCDSLFNFQFRLCIGLMAYTSVMWDVKW